MADHNKEASEAAQRFDETRSGVIQAGFFDKLAQFGYVPRDDQQAEQWLKLASLVEARQIASSENADNHVLDKLAALLSEEAGEAAPEVVRAEQELANESFGKAAALADNPSIAADVLQYALIQQQQS